MSSHPFGDLITQYLSRKHGLSQSKLAEGILQDPAVISRMCRGERLTGPQARERVVGIIGWFYDQGVLTTMVEANALLEAAGMARLNASISEEARLINDLIDDPVTMSRSTSISAKPVALIIGIKPEVKVVRAGSNRLEVVEFGTPLYPGDVLSTYSQASATVICHNDLLFYLPEHNNFKVDCANVDDPRKAGRLEAGVLNPLISLTEAFGLPPGRRLYGLVGSSFGIVPAGLSLSPRGQVTNPRPTFRWQPVEGTDRYLISVLMPGGKRWERETTDASLHYPVDAPPIAPGRNIVVTLTALGPTPIRDRTFIGLPTESRLAELAEAKSAILSLTIEEVARNYLLAQLFQGYELWFVAINQLEQLIAGLNRISPNLYLQLGQLYFKLDLYVQAEKHFREALTAAEVSPDPSTQAMVHIGLARVAAVFAETDQARHHLTTAETLYRQIGETARADDVGAERAKLG